MRTLIDGYNVMHAAGLMSRRFGPDGLRKARHRFLNDLAASLEAIEAHQTTVVFDSASSLDEAPRQTRHKGLTVLFAIGDENADERIELLIAKHSAPKGLTVVSSDHRIRDAARRRKANVQTADAFLTMLEERRSSRKKTRREPRDTTESARLESPNAEEAAHWAEVFRDVHDEPDSPGGGGGALLTDEEIERIEREVEEEFGG